MPNHVYNTIAIGEPINSEKLKEIVKAGLCQYYKPMPADTPNWYDWASKNWGTKWGAYNNELENEYSYEFTTAWCPPNDEIIAMFLKDFPNCEYIWEEEQGFGVRVEYENGEEVSKHEWDLPDWEETENSDISYLKEAYTDGDYNKYDIGYYREYSIHEYLGKTLVEAVTECK